MVDWKRVNFGIGVMGIVMLFLHAFDAIVNGAVIGGLLPNSALIGIVGMAVVLFSLMYDIFRTSRVWGVVGMIGLVMAIVWWVVEPIAYDELLSSISIILMMGTLLAKTQMRKE